MSSNVLGAALDDNVRTKPKRPLEIGRGKGIVDHCDCFCLFRYFAQFANVAHCHGGVGWSFQKEHLGVLSHTCLHQLLVGGVNKADFNSKLGEKGVDEPKGSTINDIGGEQMVSALEQREENAVSAAMPEEKARPASPPSKEQIFSTKAACVGVFGAERMYLYPGPPEKTAAACSALSNTNVEV